MHSIKVMIRSGVIRLLSVGSRPQGVVEEFVTLKYPFELDGDTSRCMESPDTKSSPVVTGQASTDSQAGESLVEAALSVDDTSTPFDFRRPDFREVWTSLLAYLLRRSPRRADADDLRQQIMTEYLEAIRTSPARCPKALLYWIAHCVLAKFYASRQHERKTLVPFDSSTPIAAALIDRGESPELQRDILWAFEQLPANKREVLLRLLNDKGRQEIAAELKLSPDTVKKYGHEARVQLRLLLRDLERSAQTDCPGDGK